MSIGNSFTGDFGKIKIGNTRIDTWGGWQPVVRYMAQAITNERKTTGTGQEVAVGQDAYQGLIATLGRFTRSKLAPATGEAINVWTGKNFVGQPITPKGEAANLLVPLVVQDALDAAKEYGWLGGGGIGAVSATGIGAQTFKGTPAGWQKDLQPYNAIPTNNEERLAKYRAATTPEERARYRLSRTDYRQRNPEVDAKLFIIGETTAFQSLGARRAAVRLMKENGIGVKDLKSLAQQEYETRPHRQLRSYFEMAMGTPSKPVSVGAG